MATDKVTVTLEVSTLAAARQQAEAKALSLSAWLECAARREIAAQGARDLADHLATPEGAEVAHRTRIARDGSVRAAIATHAGEAA